MFSPAARSIRLRGAARALLCLLLLYLPQAWPQEVETQNVSAQKTLENVIGAVTLDYPPKGSPA